MKTNLRFFWNGITAPGGKLQRAHYAKGNYTKESGIPQAAVTIYGCDYQSFSPEVREEFVVTNGTEISTDYFENDRIRVCPDHPLYLEVEFAWQKQEEHGERIKTRNTERIRKNISFAAPDRTALDLRGKAD
jgi:hypothetical protein